MKKNVITADRIARIIISAALVVAYFLGYVS
ncbi:MAG TPA: hypothetical protein DD729_08335, partial [Rhodobacteraceae bacterium]|nr:hypothetical protein [Paracoccaceae bacterium]